MREGEGREAIWEGADGQQRGRADERQREGGGQWKVRAQGGDGRNPRGSWDWQRYRGACGAARGRAANSHKGVQRGRGRVQLSEVSMDRGRAEAGQTGGTRRAQSRDRGGRGGPRLGR